MHRAGKKVHIWTVDDSETMTRLIEAGVDGIFTDRIDLLKDVLVRARPVDLRGRDDGLGMRTDASVGVLPGACGTGDRRPGTR